MSNDERRIGAMVEVKGRIDALLKEMTELSEDHFGRSPEDATWGVIGSLNHSAEQLERAAEVMRALAAGAGKR